MNRYADNSDVHKDCRNGLVTNENITTISEDVIDSYEYVFNLFWKADTDILYVLDKNNCFTGVITIGSWFRQFREGKEPFVNHACSVIYLKDIDRLYKEAEQLFEKYRIMTAIPVVDERGHICFEIRKNELRNTAVTITRFHEKITKYRNSCYLGKEIICLKKLLEEQDIVVLGAEKQFDSIFYDLRLAKSRIRFIEELENPYEFMNQNKFLVINLSEKSFGGRRDIHHYCNNGYFWDQFISIILGMVECECFSRFFQITDCADSQVVLEDFLKKYMYGKAYFSERSVFTAAVVKYMRERCFSVTESGGVIRGRSLQCDLKLNGIKVNKNRGDGELTTFECTDMIAQLYILNQRLSGKIQVLNFCFDAEAEVSDAEHFMMEEGKYEDGQYFAGRLFDYADLYSLGENGKEYLTELTGAIQLENTRTFENNRIVLKDTDSRLVHVENGIRRTCYQPEYYDGTIYCIGGCTIWGWLVEDKYTIPSLIQKYLNESGSKYRVINLGSGNFMNAVSLLESLNIRENDVFICLFPFLTDDVKTKITLIEIGKRFNELRKNEYNGIECFFNMVQHCGTNGSILYSRILFEELTKHLKEPWQKRQLGKNSLYNIFQGNFRDLDTLYGYKAYIAELKHGMGRIISDRNASVGCIVMNANPFTNGHKYLVEYASDRVDYLVLFVLEEEKSFFSFTDRYEMVKQGTSEMRNVFVVRSGSLIISSATFPAYFRKEELLSRKEECSVDTDLRVFAQYIAAAVHIQFRFVGEEPADPITARYNERMKIILPEFGIRVVEIPRKSIDGEIISASKVRAMYEKYDFENIGKQVPDTTLQYLERKISF